jgi:hypothetical protein
MEKQREINSEYLIGLLLSTSHMDAHQMDRTQTLYRRFKKHIINAVVGPMSIMRECHNKQIFADPAGRQITADLINEAYFVAKYHLPWLELHRVFHWFAGGYLKGSGMRERYHQMLLDGLDGKETDVDVLSGWLIEHGRKIGKPCHTHEALLVQVHAKLERRKKELAAQQRRDDKGGAEGDEGAQGKESTQDKEGEKPTEAELDKEEPVEEEPVEEELLEEEHLDRLEKKRRRKEERQRKMLGKQPMPEWYAKPSIIPLGKK